MRDKRRVVVTGLGMVSPLANEVEGTWAGILAGQSGIGPIDHFDASPFATRIAGTVRDFDCTRYLTKKEARRVDVFIQYGLAAANQAFEDAGLEVTEANAHRIGAFIGSGIGGLEFIENSCGILRNAGPKRVSPFFVPGSIINMVAGHLSIQHGFSGPNIATATACTSSTHALGLAARLIGYGDADVMIAGGAERAVTALGLGGFSAARALSTRNDDPAAASRPWDRDRDGFVMGDGAGILVLEEYQHARQRGARIYAELLGFGMSADAHHITAPPEDGRGAALAMSNALCDAQVDPSAVDYINAHGTSTRMGDAAEALAIKRVLGDAASSVAVSSTKSMIGHMLGAAGAVEAIFSILALRDQVAPPTINLDQPDVGCDLDFVPHRARSLPVNISVSNSFGFGGTNGSLVFGRI
jgi:3-oxoacyl-[acyl-carrier-protein] synthase II